LIIYGPNGQTIICVILQDVEGKLSSGANSVLAIAPPPVICANGEGSCNKLGSSVYPCNRCHREFYCCEEHVAVNAERHKPSCATPSNLEGKGEEFKVEFLLLEFLLTCFSFVVITQDKEYQMWYKYAAPVIYDICLNFILVWPSLTVQWLPGMTE
jgi:hypothetical protein